MLPAHKIFASYFFCFLFLLSTAAAVGGQVKNPSSTPGILSDTVDGPLPRPPERRFSIQVGAFKQMRDVERELSRVMEAGSDPFYRYEDTRDKGMWHRVYVDSYATRQDALEAAEQLKQRGVVDAYLIRKLDEKGGYFFSANRQKTNRLNADLKTEEKKRTGLVHEFGQDRKEPGTWQAEAPSNGFQKQAQTASVSDLEMSDDPVTGKKPVRLSLLDAIRYSLEGNREINVVSYTPKQALEEVENAESVYDPLLFADTTFRREPNLDSSVADIVTEDEGITRAGIRKPLKTGGHLSAYLETRYGDLNNSVFERQYKYIVAPTIELRQPLLNNFGGKREQTAINISNYQANISEEEFRQKVIEIAKNVAQVYWKLFLFKELITINQQNLAMATEVFRREDVRLAKGISQQLDVERARSNVQTRRSTLLRSRKEYRIAMDRLKLLLNGSTLNIDSDLTVIPVEAPQTVPVIVDENQAIETALIHRPEMMKAKQELMIRQADEDLTAHQRLPTLDAFGRYSLSGYGEDFDGAGDNMSLNDEDAWEVGIFFEWAIGNRSANSLYRKKILRRLQANAQLERLEDDIKLDVKQVLHGIMTARGEIEATRLAMEAAEKVVEGEFARFDIGQTSNLELLRAQDLLAVTSRSFSRAIVDYNIEMHELARAQGVLPNGVAIEMARR